MHIEVFIQEILNKAFPQKIYTSQEILKKYTCRRTKTTYGNVVGVGTYLQT